LLTALTVSGSLSFFSIHLQIVLSLLLGA